MENTEVRNSSGIGFCGVLGIAFIVLKLCGVISWSWWWVTAPLWGPMAFLIILAIAVMLFLGIGYAIAMIKKMCAKE